MEGRAVAEAEPPTRALTACRGQVRGGGRAPPPGCDSITPGVTLSHSSLLTSPCIEQTARRNPAGRGTRAAGKNQDHTASVAAAASIGGGGTD